jgi:hypothetical protein
MKTRRLPSSPLIIVSSGSINPDLKASKNTVIIFGEFGNRYKIFL